MRTRLLNLALLAALALAGFRLWRFLGEPPPTLPPISAGAALPAAVATEGGNKAEGEESQPESYDSIVARDLFSPTRGVVPPAPTAASKPAPKPLPPPKLTLYGVVIIEGDKSAYLQEGTQEGRPRKVRENESFANGIVKTIRPDGVTFLFADTEINIPLRTPKDGSGVASPGRQDVGTVPPRPQAPVAFPRRQAAPAVPQAQIPAPVRPMNVPRGISAIAPPADVGGEVIEEEEYPEGTQPEGEDPASPGEEPGE